MASDRLRDTPIGDAGNLDQSGINASLNFTRDAVNSGCFKEKVSFVKPRSPIIGKEKREEKPPVALRIDDGNARRIAFGHGSEIDGLIPGTRSADVEAETTFHMDSGRKTDFIESFG